MYKICLINMPFAALYLPSIGLTQLRSVLKSRFANSISVSLAYINQDFGKNLGIQPYSIVTHSMDHQNSGIGDWFFRQAAFPELADNIEEYFKRYYPQQNEQTRLYKQFIGLKRPGVENFLEDMVAKYKLDQVDLVGFTSMFSQNLASFAMARVIKKHKPDTITIMGGANCEFPMGQEIVKNVPYIDFVFSGPALISLLELVQNALEGRMEKCHEIRGVFSKANCHAAPASNSAVKLVTLTSKEEPINGSTCQGTIGDELDINTHIELDYESFLDSLQQHFPDNEVHPNLLFETSRGCWWGEKAHCTFCGLNGATMGYRAMSPSNALALIRSVLAYFPRCTRYNCVDNIMPKEYLKEVFPHLEPPCDLTIFYEVKADLTEEDVKTLAKARVTLIQPGIEALATSTLKLMKKGTNAFQNLLLLKNCVMYGIQPEWNLLVGFPGEQEEVYANYVVNMPLLMHLPPPSGVFPVRFDRFSPYFTYAKEYDLELHPVDYYALTYPFDKDSLERLAYYFSDCRLNAKYLHAMVKWIDKLREKHALWQTRWGGKDRSSRAMLYMKENGNDRVVYDSRSGKVVEHHLNNVNSQVLDYLSKPRRMHEVASIADSVSASVLEDEIMFLRERGLIFEENERLMSLVLPREPKPTYA